ncbi:hypothetical protein MTO96_049066 [Rhipicephalus appendiculatus]
MTVSMFTKTVRLEQAVKLINQLDDTKFSALLARILQKLPCKDERSFTEEEEQKLQRAFNCDAQEVTLLLESLSFILEQAAFHLAKPQVLRTQLTDLGMEENKVQCMVQSWTSHAKQLVEQLKQRSLAPQTAQQSAARSKRLQALVDLVVSTGAAHDHLLLQFSHGQLFNLYTQLEQIQVQLDSLI